MKIVIAKWSEKDFTLHFIPSGDLKNDLYWTLDNVGDPEKAKVRRVSPKVIKEFEFFCFSSSTPWSIDQWQFLWEVSKPI